MNENTHGVIIEIDNRGDNSFIYIKAIGKLTHDDYEAFTPELEKYLKEVDDKELLAFIDVTEFKGWELQAIWDDFKIDLKYGKKFAKIAMYGTQNYLDSVSKVSSWFMSGEMKSFESPKDAFEWLGIPII